MYQPVSPIKDGRTYARKLPDLATEELLQATSKSHLRCCLCIVCYPTDVASLGVTATAV
jgi:hypothetical protein